MSEVLPYFPVGQFVTHAFLFKKYPEIHDKQVVPPLGVTQVAQGNVL